MSQRNTYYIVFESPKRIEEAKKALSDLFNGHTKIEGNAIYCEDAPSKGTFEEEQVEAPVPKKRVKEVLEPYSNIVVYVEHQHSNDETGVLKKEKFEVPDSSRD